MCTLTAKPLDPQLLAQRLSLTLARMGLKVKVKHKNCVFSKPSEKVRGQVRFAGGSTRGRFSEKDFLFLSQSSYIFVFICHTLVGSGNLSNFLLGLK